MPFFCLVYRGRNHLLFFIFTRKLSIQSEGFSDDKTVYTRNVKI